MTTCFLDPLTGERAPAIALCPACVPESLLPFSARGCVPEVLAGWTSHGAAAPASVQDFLDARGWYCCACDKCGAESEDALVFDAGDPLPPDLAALLAEVPA